ncbi:hypothetical protein UFOVP1478_19 [uncultured Caudovirales phage]|jgi:hypothetical protein|uniref:Uncharacterized protein n=1 Tax=uncultured Caudovirales phage TaxID=2100421 RepID=A0A6J5QIH3_9CAUD|nr:hypothetical protein UFOVP1112_2 [uncultured Caudovirales phage]CAB4203989.1 hypothetical protein UFOVP1385_23 [uncultured Caudovirales phage]CAB4215345.1 hypothetical protein UFOVP1478_19 [uncultured Caudovirales phage]
MAKKYYSNSAKAMKQAGSMIKEDMSAPCLLPREVIDREFPSAGYGLQNGYHDLFGGVQAQLHKDESDLKKAFSPKKW